ncbi:site-specific integrase [Saccharopolyspora indica]|uniref:tyrosine-type recombinase/integrase n=1 Tax=Saccharopolyspora indica TaxID=1229659 RepID=UPI0022EB394D|nr:site-specific integrase [Saccharopolyspora indica]MDA3647215.1 site-specific integrase [Saccharopolyspora indica]
MAHVQDRWFAETVDPRTGKTVRMKTTDHGKTLRYRVRWIDPNTKKERSKSFPDGKKRWADAHCAKVETDIHSGSYFDPDAGKIPFPEYVESWIKGQASDPASRATLQARLNTRILPFFRAMSIEQAAQPDAVRDWMEELRTDSRVGANYSAQLFDLLSSILSGAVVDQKIKANPMLSKSIRRPTTTPHKAVAWEEERVYAIREALPGRQKAVVPLGGSVGLRQGEIFGFSLDDIEGEPGNRVVNVNRQVTRIHNKLVFRPAKGGKNRVVPLSDEDYDDLMEIARDHPPTLVELPWGEPGGKKAAAWLLVVPGPGAAWNNSQFNSKIWRRAFRTAGLTYRPRIDGVHGLRHTFASVVLSAGVTIRDLADFLGHKDPGFTLRVYAHMMPSAYGRARTAIGRFFRRNTARATLAA